MSPPDSFAPRSTFTVRRRVAFHETDAAGIAHFSNFFRYMETAEHEFLRSIGLSAADPAAPDHGWPRVHASCDFARPLVFEEEVEVRLRIERIGRSSVRYAFAFHAGDGERIAKGSMVTSYVARNAHGRLRAVPLPPDFVARVTVADAPERE